MTAPFTHTFDYPNGSQVLVEVWPDGATTLAFREDQWATWGPPQEFRTEGVADGADRAEQARSAGLGGRAS